ncbi:MAG: DNA translocase FtsK, partial [Oscillospiraceae bacterium]|nr:DNA translocase FtsK [Oscillospiraceae bacterium]
LRHNAERLVAVLDEYGVDVSVIDISQGPAITRYELKPAPGVKISKITSLTNDIALRLAAKAVRIEAPIPGKPAVGVEIPNQHVSTVKVRELIDTEAFRKSQSPVTVSVGKDIEGNIVLADLSKMPHLLVAGSTGSGKSVCINSMIISLIYKSPPEELRLIMVDPKAVEMDVYNGIPHLLVPVVCDPKKAAGALQWAVNEMLKRYALLKEKGVRNLDGYNKLAERDPSIEKLPRIVIIIDEMADLMQISPKEVEDAIARLAAMARAAGMHMVLATQRPSVDVITGTIKNNIPSRIAFAVSSQVDSRTILDEGGAEGLIGMGDMLFNPVGAAKPRRVQGCFVSDEEVESVVKFIKQNSSADYDEAVAKEIERNAGDSPDGDGIDMGDVDVLFNKAVEVCIEGGQASTAMLQRRLGIGYARAGRLIDQLEQRGVVGPFEGSKPRSVLMSRPQFLEMSAAGSFPKSAQVRLEDIAIRPPANDASADVLIRAATHDEDEDEEDDEDINFEHPPF